jgi:5-methyltetrahydrofolate--homocysteine methyltransferase
MSSRFLDAVHSGRVLLMDGAMGTELLRDGLPPGTCGESWNLTHPDRVRAIHTAYIQAGAECLLTHTFQANRSTLERTGRAEQLPAIARAAITLAREAAGAEQFVLADVGPIADLDEIAPALPQYRAADALLLETFSDPVALCIAERCRADLGGEFPVFLSLAYRRDVAGMLGTQTGHPPEWYAQRAEKHGVAALGVNCGRDMGMEDIREILDRYRQATSLPLFARPNAGTPTRVADRWVYPLTPELMAGQLPALLAVGVALVGGCCGTTPEHISAARQALASGAC